MTRALVPFVLVFLAAGGCATGFSQIDIDPPAPAAPAPPPRPYAQVRQFGVATKLVWIAYNSSWQLGVTVDVRNDTGGPLTLDLPRARVELDAWNPGDRASAAAVAAGPGPLPAQVRTGAAQPRAITLAADEGNTFWMVFARLERVPVNPRVTVHIPAGTSPLVIPVLDPSGAQPVRRLTKRGRTGAYLTGLEHQDLGDVQISNVRLGLLSVQGSFRIGFGVGFGTLFVRSGAAYDRAFAGPWDLSLSWRPSLIAVGAFVSARATYLIFEEQASFEDKLMPSVSAGLELPVAVGTVVPGALRLGITHAFDKRLPSRTGLFLAVEVPAWTW